jgi:hypothetical protein
MNQTNLKQKQLKHGIQALVRLTDNCSCFRSVNGDFLLGFCYYLIILSCMVLLINGGTTSGRLNQSSPAIF